MVQLKKQNTFYEVSYETEKYKINGSFTLTNNDLIYNLLLHFYVDDNSIGTSNIDERSEYCNYSYNITNTENKKDIINLTDTILLDIKQQIIKTV